MSFQTPARYVEYEDLRAQGNVVWSDEHGGWLAFGFEECDRILRDAATFASTNRRDLISDERWEELCSVLGGPRAMTLLPEAQHAPMIAQVRRRFASSMPHYLETRVHPVIDHFLTRFLDAGGGEFCTGFADVVPPAVIASVLGLPWDDPDLLLRWKSLDSATVEVASRFDRHPDERGRRSVAELYDLVRPIVESRRDDPQDDFISQLWEFVPGILPGCTTDDVLAQCRQMFLGGSHTSSFLMANCAVLLFDDPELWRRMKARPDTLGRFIEEVLRVVGVAQVRPRIIAADTTLGGRELRSGELIYAVLAAANRDGERYRCPFSITLDEDDRMRHVAFGAGSKTCGGMALARAEVGDVFRTLLEYIDNPRLDPDKPAPQFAGDSFTGWRPVHVLFDDVRPRVQAAA